LKGKVKKVVYNKTSANAKLIYDFYENGNVMAIDDGYLYHYYQYVADRLSSRSEDDDWDYYAYFSVTTDEYGKPTRYGNYVNYRNYEYNSQGLLEKISENGYPLLQ